MVRALRALDSASIPWALTGSFAMAAHGFVRATNDADIKILVGPLKGYEVVLTGAMKNASFSRIDDHTFEASSGFIVEFYPVRGALDRETFDRRIRVDALPRYGAEVWIVTVEDLVLLKLREYALWRSAVQLEDVRALLASQQAAVDLDLLERKVKRHSLEAPWREVAAVRRPPDDEAE